MGSVVSVERLSGSRFTQREWQWFRHIFAAVGAGRYAASGYQKVIGAGACFQALPFCIKESLRWNTLMIIALLYGVRALVLQRTAFWIKTADHWIS